MSRGQDDPNYVPTDPGQVLDVLRDVLLEHMDWDEALPCYRVQDVLLIDKRSGALVDDDDEIHVVGRTLERRASDAGLPDDATIVGKFPEGLALLLLMRNGSRLRLVLTDEGQEGLSPTPKGDSP